MSVSSLSSDLTKAHNVRHFRTSLDMLLLYFEKVCSPFLRHLSRRCWRWGSAGPPSLSPSHSRAQSENIVTSSDYVPLQTVSWSDDRNVYLFEAQFCANGGLVCCCVVFSNLTSMFNVHNTSLHTLL